MKRKINLIIIPILLFIVTSISHAQVVGQIFTKEEANQKYGPVKEFVSFTVRDLEIILNKSDEYVMFNILDKKLYILNSQREVLYPAGGAVDDDQIFYFFSKEIVHGLINFVEKKPDVQIELREEVLSITHGAFTLEMTQYCPPICP